MPTIKLDLKQFKHVGSDDKSTTLEHAKDKHTIILAHKSLSKDNQEALKAMANSSIKAKSAAEGVQKAKDRREKDNQGSSAGEVIEVNKDESEDYGKVTDREGKKPKVFAKGGEVQHYAEGIDDVEAVQPPPMLSKDPTDVPQDPLMAGVTTPNPMSNREPSQEETPKPQVSSDAIKQYNLDVASKMARSGEDSLDMLIRPDGSPGAKGIDTDAWAQAKAKVEQEKLNSQANQLEAQNKQHADIVKQNAVRAELGQPLLPEPASQAIPSNPDQPQTPQGAAQQGSPQPAQPGMQQQAPAGANPFDPSAGVSQGYNTQIQGLQQQAKAQGELGQQQSEILQKQQEANQLAQEHFQSQVNEINVDTQKYQQDIQNGYVDPNKYWEGYTAPNGDKVPGHSRVAAAIGMLLAGFNPTSRPNAVMEMVNNEINQSMDAQKTNLNSSNNLLRANLERFRNAKDATDMTRVMMNENFMAQLQSAVAKAQTPMAQAAAMQAIGPLQRENAQLQTKIALNQAIMNISKDPKSAKNPEMVGHLISQLDAMGDERAKGLKERYVPGIGLSNVPVPQDIRQELVGKKNFDNLAQHYMSWVKQNSGTMNPSKVRQGATMAAELQGAYRQAIKGGVYKEGEQEFIEKLIPSKPDQFLGSIRTLPKIQELINNNGQQLNTLKSTYGLPTEQPQVQPVERFDKASGKTALFDPSTKKFLGYKQ